MKNVFLSSSGLTRLHNSHEVPHYVHFLSAMTISGCSMSMKCDIKSSVVMALGDVTKGHDCLGDTSSRFVAPSPNVLAQLYCGYLVNIALIQHVHHVMSKTQHQP